MTCFSLRVDRQSSAIYFSVTRAVTAPLRIISRGRLVRLMVLVGTRGLSAEFRARNYSVSGQFPYTFPPVSPKVSRLERANAGRQFSWRNGSIVLSSRGTL